MGCERAVTTPIKHSAANAGSRRNWCRITNNYYYPIARLQPNGRPVRVCDCTAMATIRRRYVATMLFMLTFWQTQQLGKSCQLLQIEKLFFCASASDTCFFRRKSEMSDKLSGTGSAWGSRHLPLWKTFRRRQKSPSRLISVTNSAVIVATKFDNDWNNCIVHT